MEMIQLMGTPSIDRQTQASLGKQGSAEMLDGGVDSEFTSHLEAAITGVQKKEVNPDELIAQLVGLDLNSGVKPTQLMSGGADYDLDLNVGQIEGETLDEKPVNAGLAADIVPQNGSRPRKDPDIYGERDKSHLYQGSRTSQDSDIYGSRPQFREPAVCYIDPNFGDLPKGAGNGPDADVDLSLAIKNGVRDWISKQDLGSRTVNTGILTSGDPNDSVTPAVDPTLDRLNSQFMAGYAPLIDPVVTKTDIDSVTNAVQVLGTAEPAITQVAGFNGSRTHTEKVSSDRDANQRITPGSSDSTGGLAKIGYRGTGQGRPDDLLQLGLRTDKNILIEKGVPSLTLTDLGNDTTPVVTSTVDPRELNKLNPARVVTTETAPAIIEGLAGKLTRESFAIKPTVIATPQVQSGEATQVSGQALTQGGGVPSITQNTKSETRNKVKTDLAADVASADSSTVLNTDSADVAAMAIVSSDRAVVSKLLGKEFEETDLLEKQDVEGISAESFETSVRTDSSKNSARIDESRSAANGKSEVEVALNAAREKIAEAVMDLAAARRPQTIKIQLTPHDLGTIDVSVRSMGGRVDVELKASDDGVRQGLMANRADLVRTIESGGTSVGSMNVGQHLGQDAGQAGHRGSDQATREDFQHAVNLGQVSTNAETLAIGSTSYGTAGNGRVDLAA